MNAYLSAVELESELDKTVRGDQGAAQRIIDHNKALIAAIAQAKRDTWEEAANDLSHGLPAMWKKALIDRCLFKKDQVKP